MRFTYLLPMLAVCVIGLLLSGACYAGSAKLRATASVKISAPTGRACSRVLTKFDLPSDIEGSEVDYAELRIPVAAQAMGRDIGIRVFRVDRSWSSSNATWLAPWRTPGGDLVRVPGAVTIMRATMSQKGPLEIALDATAIVQYWADHPSENYGVAVTSLDPGAVVNDRDVAPSAEDIVLKIYFTPRSR